MVPCYIWLATCSMLRLVLGLLLCLVGFVDLIYFNSVGLLDSLFFAGCDVFSLICGFSCFRFSVSCCEWVLL